MSIVHEIQLNTEYITSTSSNFKADTPIGVIGIAETSTLAVNKIHRIRSKEDVELLGQNIDDNTIRPIVEILQKYGCNNIFIIRVEKGADDTGTITNIIGTPGDVNTGLYLFRETFTLFKENIDFLLIPGYSEETIITPALSILSEFNGMLALDFPTGSTVTNIQVTRETTSGLGTKNSNLLVFAPKVVNDDDQLEPLSAHTIGAIAKETLEKGFGHTSSNNKLIGVKGVESGFDLSYTKQTASNQELERLGVMSVNINSGGYVTWGNRNALYHKEENNSIETYYVTKRISQEMGQKIDDVTTKFIDEPCNFSTAMLLQTALNNIISSNINAGNLRAGSRAVFNDEKSNYCDRRLVYNFELAYNLPTELIVINSTYSIKI